MIELPAETILWVLHAAGTFLILAVLIFAALIIVFRGVPK